MDLDNLSEQHQSQLDFFREQTSHVTPPDSLYQASTENTWWWGEIIVIFTGGPEGSHWHAMVRDLGGTRTQVRATCTGGSSFPALVGALGVYVGAIRNLHQLQDRKGSWNFNSAYGIGLGSMFLENNERVHVQPIMFGGVATPSDFRGTLAFGKVHPQP